MFLVSNIFNSIALYYCYVYVFFCLCYSPWYENEANNFIGKNDNKKNFSFSFLPYTLLPFHLQDSLLFIFDTIWHQWYFISIQKNFFSIHIVYRFISIQIMSGNEINIQVAAIFLFALKISAPLTIEKHETTFKKNRLWSW